MSFLVGLLTLVMVLNCGLLVLLVLIQLPKKDAGTGVAFGGAAADALFGAGSGNALTKITKWSAIAFFVLALLLGYLQDNLHRGADGSAFTKMVQQQQTQTAISTPPPVTPAPASAKSPAASPTNSLLSIPLTPTTTPAAPAPAK